MILHKENCIDGTAESLGETERTTLLPGPKTGDICSNICMEDTEGSASDFGIERYSRSRTGYHCTVLKVPVLTSSLRTTMYCNNMGYKNLEIFNALPKYLRDLRGMRVVEVLQCKVPDEPISKQQRQTVSFTKSQSPKINHWKGDDTSGAPAWPWA